MIEKILPCKKPQIFGKILFLEFARQQIQEKVIRLIVFQFGAMLLSSSMTIFLPQALPVFRLKSVLTSPKRKSMILIDSLHSSIKDWVKEENADFPAL